jgi:hypothetical protein
MLFAVYENYLRRIKMNIIVHRKEQQLLCTAQHEYILISDG